MTAPTDPSALGGAAKHALVIGIDQYEEPWGLQGCVNDARLMATILEEKFEFDKSNIRTLIDGEATKDGILDAIDDLIDRVTDERDVAVIYFAGHGSQLQALSKARKASGFSTALCPVDVTHPGPELYFLIDDEIHERLLCLADKTSYITMIVDACHSGTVTRDLFGDRVRQMSAKTIADGNFVLHNRPSRHRLPVRDDSNRGPSGWLSLSDRYVLIAASRDEEVANEFRPKDGDTPHGALTYFLSTELKDARSGMSYRDIFERSAASVTAHKPLQHPQMEGQVDRAIFGVADLAPMDFATITAVSSRGRVTLNRGTAMGMTKGSTFEVYAQGTKRIPQEESRDGGDDTSTGGARLATIEIESVRALESIGVVKDEASSGAIVVGARAFETSHARPPMTMSVEIVAASNGGSNDANVDRDTADLVAALQKELASSRILAVVGSNGSGNGTGDYGAGGRQTPFARAYLIGPRTTITDATPVPQLGAVDSLTWAVVGTTGALVMPPKQPGDEALIRENLEKIVRYTQALEIGNVNPRSKMRGNFKLELLCRDASDAWVAAEGDRAGGLPVYTVGDSFAFRVTSTFPKAAYISVLEFKPNYAMDVFYPDSGAQEAVAPHGVFEPGAVPRGDPDEWVLECDVVDGVADETSTIKLFLTAGPADFSMLEQEATRGEPSSVTSLFRQAIGVEDQATRSATKPNAVVSGDDDWTTLTASFILRHPDRKT